MAFCPNCGTPNTDQAEKCVSCGFELAPKQKAKFKGTMMMAGIKVPGQPPGPGAQASAPPPEPSAQAPSEKAPTAAPASEPPAGDRNLAFQKTMLGHSGMVAPNAPPPAQPAAPHAVAPAATIQGPGPQFTPTPAQSPSAHSAATGAGSSFGSSAGQGGGFASSSGSQAGGFAGSSGSGSFGGGSSTGGFGEARTLGPGSASIDSHFPGNDKNKPNPGKVLAIGCAALLVLFCAVSGILWATFSAKLKALLGSSDSAAEATAWQASITQSLTQVSALCQSDCQQASVFFHPSAPAVMLEESKGLTPAKIQKLGDPESAKAEMLDATNDQDLATKLGLDPQQCARVIAGAAKVVSCSVPEADGKPSVLRIVHLSGVDTL